MNISLNNELAYNRISVNIIIKLKKNIQTINLKVK